MSRVFFKFLSLDNLFHPFPISSWTVIKFIVFSVIGEQGWMLIVSSSPIRCLSRYVFLCVNGWVCPRLTYFWCPFKTVSGWIIFVYKPPFSSNKILHRNCSATQSRINRVNIKNCNPGNQLIVAGIINLVLFTQFNVHWYLYKYMGFVCSMLLKLGEVSELLFSNIFLNSIIFFL